jgi:alpha-methylacyl-CoA racemase
MLLADLGADVVRVGRVGAGPQPWNVATRGRRSIQVDLRHPEGGELVRALAARADGMFEGFRPGVAERLGVGPDQCRSTNPRLVYGRMTGWGQSGPLAGKAGHDIDYIAIAGALYGLGDPERPPRPPWNLVGDYGGGAMFLALGMVSAMLHAAKTGEGQVVDAAMTDGTALLTAMFHGRMATGEWSGARGENPLDGSAPYYGAYECADGEFMAFGAIEPQFTADLLAGLGLGNDEELRQQWYEPEARPKLRERVASVVRTRPRAEWVEVFRDLDACAAPVLSLAEATRHPHNVERSTFIEVGGVMQPAPAPRFSATPAEVRSGVPLPGQHTAEILSELGYDRARIDRLTGAGVVE